MKNLPIRLRRRAWIPGVLLAATLAGSPALAQAPAHGTTDGAPRPIEAGDASLVGKWITTHSEDLWERRSGLEVGDFTGVPLNEAGRLGAASWDPGWFAIPEEQCRPHTGIYTPRAPWDIAIEAEYSQDAHALVAYHFYASINSRTVYMDGRPHPPAWERHTWMGFSTGRWEGDTLVVRTTHNKAGYLQRNGIPHSDRAVALEYFTRQDDTLLVTSFIDDPGYLSEPMIKTTSFTLDASPGARAPARNSCTPFEVIDEAPGRVKHFVPHILPGQYDQAREFQVKRKVPPETAFGGAETLYPEYIPKLKAYRDAFVKTLTVDRPRLVPGAGQPGFVGYWALDRSKSEYNVSWKLVGVDDRDGSAPENRTMAIAPAADGGLKHTVDTQVVANDTGVHRQEYTVKLDGRDYPTKGGAIETYALRRIDANTFERIGKIKGQVVETARITVSPDGSVLTIANKGAINKQTYDNVQVFNRESQ